MKAHENLWNEAVYSDSVNENNYLNGNITSSKHFHEMRDDKILSYKAINPHTQSSEHYRMWMCFFALYFGGTLEV